MKKIFSKICLISVGLLGLSSSASAALTMPTPDYTDFSSTAGLYLTISVAVLLGGYVIKRFFRI